MIQDHSCNLFYSCIVMNDGVFERVSAFVMISCFLKKMAHVFLSVNCLIGLFSLHFCLFENWLSFNTIYCLICLQKLSKYFFIIGLYVQLLHQLFMFSISKLFTHVTGIFTVTLQAIFIPP